MNKPQTKWRWAATAEELRKVKEIDKQLRKMREVCRALSSERRQITTRCGVRANERGL